MESKSNSTPPRKEQDDPLIKREKFAVSLRKKKRDEILGDKRSRLREKAEQIYNKIYRSYDFKKKFGKTHE